MAAPFTFQNLGLRDAGAGSATLLIEGGLPLMVAVLGVAILRERVNGSRVAGLLLGVGGVAVVAVTELGGGMPLTGGPFSLAAALALAVYTVLGRKIYREGFSLAVLTGGTTVGTLMLVPLASTEIGIFGTFMPVVGITAAATFLGEAITLPQIVGAALIAAGMVVTARTTPLRRPRRAGRRRGVRPGREADRRPPGHPRLSDPITYSYR